MAACGGRVYNVRMLIRRIWPGLVLLVAVVAAVVYASRLQLSSTSFCDPDSYYHIAVSRFLKDYGPHYQFRWAQFSVLKDSFADKDILFHLTIVPFFSFSGDPVTAGKYAFILQALFFILAYVFVLKRYLPAVPAALFLFLPFLSSTFTSYFLQLRSMTMANALAILAIYALIGRRAWWLCLIAALYALTHISFFTLIGIVLVAEALRYAFSREFCLRNIYAVISGSAAGCLLNPGFPHNIYAAYLNGIALPLAIMGGATIGSGSEHMAFDTKLTLVTNAGVFIALNIIAWSALLGRRRLSFASAVWGAVTNLYLALAFFGNRYWYQVNVLAFIFLASYVHDWVEEGGWKAHAKAIGTAAAIACLLFIPFVKSNRDYFRNFMEFGTTRNSHLESVARWMGKNLPADETVYHSSFSDAAIFMCLNPKDNYINVADPIYMYSRYPEEARLLDEMMLGRLEPAYAAIRGIFHARYAYVSSLERPLLRQLAGYPGQVKVLHEDTVGTVFEITVDDQRGNDVGR